jgi:hypothetical protein
MMAKTLSMMKKEKTKMPSASDELRTQMKEYFGDPIADGPPMEYLRNQGFTLNRDWTWSKPDITNYGQLSEKEYHCILFLVQEWDMGGLKNA